MQSQFAKWGNSLALRIPKAIAETVNAADGGAVTISVEDGAIMIRPAGPSYTIEQLCKGLKPMPEVDTGAPVGNEAL